MFAALSRAGGKAFSNMAVGYNNVDVNAANKYGVAIGNTPVSSFSRGISIILCLFLVIMSISWVAGKREMDEYDTFDQMSQRHFDINKFLYVDG